MGRFTGRTLHPAMSVGCLVGWSVSRLVGRSLFTFFGQRPRRGRSPVEHRGTFVRSSVRPSVRPFVCPPPQALSNQPSQPSNQSCQGLNQPSQASNQASQAFQASIPCVLQDFVPFGALFGPNSAPIQHSRVSNQPSRVSNRPSRVSNQSSQASNQPSQASNQPS